tara:strand:- start:59 stop:1444 length:1386 start_codon:yes stop_codon:yes gene_type:complete
MQSNLASWASAFAVYCKPRVLAMLFLGFSAGLPLLLVFSTLTAWLNDMGVARSTIGFFGWVGITYSVKVFWAPVVDRLPLPWLTSLLGKRRSWMLLGQLGVIGGIVLMVSIDPQTQLWWLALAAVFIAFFSATQDIAIDAYRIEAVITQYQGAMSATYVFGYRLAMLVAGAGTLFIAEPSNWSLEIALADAWQFAYLSMAALMSVGVITVLIVSEPEHKNDSETEQLEAEWVNDVTRGKKGKWQRLQAWFVSAVVCPFADFLHRHGRFALVILAFVGCYRISDIVMGVMANPFYLDLGFSKNQIAAVGKIFGFIMTLLGAFTGGILVVRFGVFRPLLAGAIMVAATNLLFAQLALVGADVNWLALVISADNFSGGFANAAFIAFLSGLVNRAYTATQYALFSSFMTLPGKFFSGFSGVLVDASSYYEFFIYAAVMGIPAIIFSVIVMRHPMARAFIHSTKA